MLFYTTFVVRECFVCLSSLCVHVNGMFLNGCYKLLLMLLSLSKQAINKLVVCSIVI